MKKTRKKPDDKSKSDHEPHEEAQNQRAVVRQESRGLEENEINNGERPGDPTTVAGADTAAVGCTTTTTTTSADTTTATNTKKKKEKKEKKAHNVGSAFKKRKKRAEDEQ